MHPSLLDLKFQSAVKSSIIVRMTMVANDEGRKEIVRNFSMSNFFFEVLNSEQLALRVSLIVIIEFTT